jgi:hypothetical protein
LNLVDDGGFNDDGFHDDGFHDGGLNDGCFNDDGFHDDGAFTDTGGYVDDKGRLPEEFFKSNSNRSIELETLPTLSSTNIKDSEYQIGGGGGGIFQNTSHHSTSNSTGYSSIETYQGDISLNNPQFQRYFMIQYVDNLYYHKLIVNMYVAYIDM